MCDDDYELPSKLLMIRGRPQAAYDQVGSADVGLISRAQSLAF
jgi:hypothetical protein